MAKENAVAKDLGLLILRVGIGLIFIKHGYPKLMAGQEKWIWLGNQMVYVGITFAPAFWGFMAAIAECIGGGMLILGLATRLASFLMASTMLVALLMHINVGDPYVTYSHPLSLLVVFMSLFISGAGAYSLDSLFKK
jgi:putative oxidoreductase